MAEAVKEDVKIGRKKFPGYIETRKSDEDFLYSVLLEWAQFEVNEAVELLQDARREGWLEDKYLRKVGFDTEKNIYSDIIPESVTLIKYDVGKWVVVDMSFEEMEEFAEGCEGNLSEQTSDAQPNLLSRIWNYLNKISGK